MYCWRPRGAHAQILLQMCTQMLPNWFPQSKVTRNQCTIFHFIFQRLYKAGKREAYWMDLHWCPGMLWCHREQPGCRVLCGCPAADKPSLCSARSPMCLFCSILEKWVLKQSGQKLWPEGSSTSWEWPLALSEQSFFLSKTLYRRSGSWQTLCQGNTPLQPQPPFKFHISLRIPKQKYLHAWS